MEEADKFLETLDFKSKNKVIFNVRVAELTNDPELFKKLNENIWEFRTRYLGKSDCWRSGIKPIKKILWFLQRMGLSKRPKKHQRMRLKEQKELEKIILTQKN